MPQVLEALQLAKQLAEQESRIAALNGLLPFLPPLEWEQTIEVMLTSIAGSEHGHWHLNRLAQQTARLPPRRLYPIISNILESASTSMTRSEFYELLKQLTPVLYTLGHKDEIVRTIQVLLEVEEWWS
jgi:hypothetical protein